MNTISNKLFLFLSILFAVLLVLFGASISSCGRADGGYRAERFIGANGRECFVIISGDGNAVGGNCL